MSFLARMFGTGRPALLPLYNAVVAAGRAPLWYRDGGVPDTIEGRFDTIAALLALVLLRIEREEPEGRDEAVLLTEIFIDDMEGTVRELGIGDVVVGKHVGRLVGALGGRLGALREAAAGSQTMEEVVRRNFFRDSSPTDESVAFVAARLTAFRAGLDSIPLGELLAGRVPAP